MSGKSAFSISSQSDQLTFAEGVKYYKCDITDPKAIAEVAKKVREEVSQATLPMIDDED